MAMTEVGYDLDLFVDPVSDELICSICRDVKRDPAELVACQHSFCRTCISAWMTDKSDCPACRTPARRSRDPFLRDSRALRNIINELKIRCKFNDKGCEQVVKVESLESHLKECKFNFHSCTKGCGAKITPAVAATHTCVRWLGAENERLTKELNAQKEKIAELERARDEKNDRLENLHSQLQTALVSIQNLSTQVPQQEVVFEAPHEGQPDLIQRSLPAMEVPISFPCSMMQPTAAAFIPQTVPIFTPTNFLLTTTGSKSILVAGGMHITANNKKKSMRSVHLFDPTSNCWHHLPPLTRVRSQHMAVALPDPDVPTPGSSQGSIKKIVQMGGFNFESSLASSETSTITSSQEVNYLGGWLEDMPAMFVGRSAAGCAVMDGKIFVYGGLHAKKEYLSSMESYSLETNQWSREQMMKTKRASFGAAYLEGSLYAVGGVHLETTGGGGGDLTPSALEWTPMGGTTRRPQMRNVTKRWTPSVEVEKTLNTVERYSALQQKWVEVTPMQVRRKSLCLIAVPKSVHGGGGGALYAIGGFHGSTRTEVECYDPSTKSWTMKRPLPVGVMDASAARVDHYIYVFGGFDGTEITDRVWRYDTKQDSWSEAEPLPERKSFSTAVVI